MNRKGFLSGLLAIGGFGFLAKPKTVVHDGVCLLNCYVAGFRYYDGPMIIDQIQVGDLLEMKRQPLNEHDWNAIALYHNDRMIGYVPMVDNGVISKLMDYGKLDVTCSVTAVNKGLPWHEAVEANVFLLIDRNEIN